MSNDDPQIERDEDHLARETGKCAHCQNPSNRFLNVGPIVLIVQTPRDDTCTLGFCSWRCVAHWAAETYEEEEFEAKP
jgi:hypothetical protein